MDIRLMPYSRKHTRAVENTELIESFATEYFRKNLGEEPVSEFRLMLDGCTTGYPDEASVKEMYETGYSNWICTVRSEYAIARDRLDERGMEDYIHAKVDAFKRNNSGPALVFLAFVRSLAPGRAFRMAVRELAYQLQWLTPYAMTEFNGKKAVLDIPNCKILEYPDVDDVCSIGCQRMYPTCLKEQFHLNVNFHREGVSCTCTIERMG